MESSYSQLLKEDAVRYKCYQCYTVVKLPGLLDIIMSDLSDRIPFNASILNK